MMAMINCLKCYHCEKIGNIVYCPFFDINPCYRGKHIILNLPEHKKQRVIHKHINSIEVPETLKRSKYYPNLKKFLIELIQKGQLSHSSREFQSEYPYEYINKILEYNGITKEELKYYEYE